MALTWLEFGAWRAGLGALSEQGRKQANLGMTMVLWDRSCARVSLVNQILKSHAVRALVR